MEYDFLDDFWCSMYNSHCSDAIKYCNNKDCMNCICCEEVEADFDEREY